MAILNFDSISFTLNIKILKKNLIQLFTNSQYKYGKDKYINMTLIKL